ncbi:uncharacterized protein LOC111710947 isoform X2 [Eurytemora carolleeae]|uniref:uncharacterized protein LOC111710947 isoform X2 n=1 Tax=Eurytemora carolleeae TaxID=1294199 RepID=UPI000C761A4A|nr:uncharacterized protein LOC111710947 isoform X2 [Eurytemora carolleeae]|eukprot:XP_023340922.1 uncharacterized protein LOC111710947 isoform X2 [Eurytemora affinis]
MSLDVYSQEDLDLYKAISAEQGFLTQVSLLSAMDDDGVTQGFKFEDIVQQVDNNTPECIRSSQAFKRRRELQKNKKCQIFLKMNQAQLISLEKSTPLIQFESSLQSPPNPFTEPSRSSPDSSFNSALHSANPGDFNDTPKPGFSTKQRQDTPFSWIDNSLPLSTGKVNLKNAFRKSLRKSLRKSKSAKAAIRKRSIYMVEVDDKASEGTDGTENEKVQVQAKIQGDCCWILFSSTYFQGRRETVCGGERTISIPAVNSVKKV